MLNRFAAGILSLAGFIVAVVMCMLLGFLAFLAWLVHCTGPFYEGGCDPVVMARLHRDQCDARVRRELGRWGDAKRIQPLVRT